MRDYREYLRSLLSTDTESEENSTDSQSLADQYPQFRQKPKRQYSDAFEPQEIRLPLKKARKAETRNASPTDSRVSSRSSSNDFDGQLHEQSGAGNHPTFNQGTNVYSDPNIDINIRGIEHQRNTRFRAEDHLYEINIIPRRRTAPLLLSLEMALKEALLSILFTLRNSYPHNLHHQVYITIIEKSILHGLNTGNFDLNAPPKDIVNRALTIFHSYLKSKQTMQLNDSFKIQVKVLSHNHSNLLELKNPRFRKRIFRDFSKIRN